MSTKKKKNTWNIFDTYRDTITSYLNESNFGHAIDYKQPRNFWRISVVPLAQSNQNEIPRRILFRSLRHPGKVSKKFIPNPVSSFRPNQGLSQSAHIQERGTIDDIQKLIEQLVDTIKDDAKDLEQKIKDIIADIQQNLPGIIQDIENTLQQDLAEVEKIIQQIVGQLQEGQEEALQCVTQEKDEIVALQQKIVEGEAECTEAQVAEANRIAQAVRAEVAKLVKDAKAIIAAAGSCGANPLCLVGIVGKVSNLVNEVKQQIGVLKNDLANLAQSWANDAQVCLTKLGEEVAAQEQEIGNKIVDCIKTHWVGN